MLGDASWHLNKTAEDTIRVSGGYTAAKADALKWYKEAIVAVGSRVFYIGVGAIAMFVVSHVL